jgi:hypothetical protein
MCIRDSIKVFDMETVLQWIHLLVGKHRTD